MYFYKYIISKLQVVWAASILLCRGTQTCPPFCSMLEKHYSLFFFFQKRDKKLIGREMLCAWSESAVDYAAAIWLFGVGC